MLPHLFLDKPIYLGHVLVNLSLIVQVIGDRGVDLLERHLWEILHDLLGSATLPVAPDDML